MHSTTVGSTLLLLAGAVAAQQSESVVTEIPSSLIQTTEQVFTIQTSFPTSFATGVSSVCYEVCVQEPCNACSATTSGDPAMSLPVESLPVPSSISDGDVTMTLPIVSLPSVGTEPTSLASVTSTLLPSLSQTTDPAMSIPQGETPESTGVTATSSGSGNASASASSSPPAEQTTAAAPPSLRGDSTPFIVALGVSSMSILLGAAWTLF